MVTKKNKNKKDSKSLANSKNILLLIFLILLSTATVLIYILTRSDKSKRKRTERSTKKPINGSESVIPENGKSTKKPENGKSTKKPENIESNDTSNTGLIIGLSIGLIFYFSGVAFSLYNNKGVFSFASWFALLFPTGRSSFIVEDSIKPKKRKTVAEKRKNDIEKELNTLKKRANLSKVSKLMDKITIEPTILKKAKLQKFKDDREKFKEKLNSVLKKGKNIKVRDSLKFLADNKKYNDTLDNILKKENITKDEKSQMMENATKIYQKKMNKVLPLYFAEPLSDEFKDWSNEQIEAEMNLLRDKMISESI
jgi:DNA repair exonuclease SbcCD nuclease subunit